MNNDRVMRWMRVAVLAGTAACVVPASAEAPLHRAEDQPASVEIQPAAVQTRLEPAGGGQSDEMSIAPAALFSYNVRPVSVPDLSAGLLDPGLLARMPSRDLRLGAINLGKQFSAGVSLREERDEWAIPDLGSGSVLPGNFDAGAVAQDIQASSNRLLAQPPRKNSLRMNFLKFDNSEYRMDVTQHPSRTGLRFHHLGTGLRIEAERRYINSATNIFVGVRLLEDRRLDPTIGCTVQSSSKQLETRNFCGFRLRIGL